ncbi:MAG: hypothetical protein A2Y38_18150 [Spirochaetes bacterium GWB1_59_5]|nr:MAG: hypothetical protein A2Y38_18150 [Spirochaetes bacterium GWB1_59_5]
MNASWTALHVQGTIPDADPEALERNLELARSLGADVFSLPDDEVAASIIRYARIKKATALVIGKTGNGNAAFRGKRSVMDAILRESGDLDVIVLRGKNPVPHRRRLAVARIVARPRDLIIAFLAVLGVTLLGFLAQPALGYRSVSILYLLVIICLPFACGRTAVIAGAVLSALLWNYLFVPPKFTFGIDSLEDLLMFTAFFLAAFMGGFLTSRVREKEAALALRERRTALLYGFTRALTRGRGIEEIVALGSVYIGEYLGADIAIWMKNDNGKLDLDRVLGAAEGTPPGVLPGALAQTCFAANEVIENGEGLLYLPLGAPDSVIGVIGVAGRDGKAFSGEGRELVSTLTGNIALALERELLAASNEAHKLVDESARLSRVLLNHVSHELRTPLTTIKGSVSGLVDGSVDDDPELRSALLAETLKAADTLNTLVENLLSMSRLETGSLRPRPERTYVAELLGAAQASLASELSGRDLQLDPVCADAEFEVDPVLMVQVFRNLIRNYAAYTPSDSRLTIEARIEEDSIHLRFSDNGPGVPERELASLFDTFYRGSNSTSHQGCGLGLSICRGIVEAHGGTINARTADGGGLTVTVILPRKP